MRIPSGVVDQGLYFVGVDATDFVTRETGLSSFTVVRSRNGAADVTYTTPTITEIDSSTMPGVYFLLLDEDMTLDAGDQSQEVALHITHAGMAPVTRTFELYRPSVTAGETLTVSSGAVGTVNALANGSITAAAIATGAIDADAIADNAIDAGAIAADAITAAKIADGAIDANTFAAGAITAAAIATGAIDADATAADFLAEINAEVVDALNTDTYGEPTGVPGATVSLAEKIGRMYMALRNKITITNTKKTFYDDGDAAEWEQDISNDGTTYTQSEANAI